MIEELIKTYVTQDKRDENDQPTSNDTRMADSTTSSQYLSSDEAFEQLVTLTYKGDLQLAQLIEKMGSYLTNQDVLIRKRALFLIHAILVEVSPTNFQYNFVTKFSAEPLLTFICSRLGDFPSVAPCLQLLKTILSSYYELLPEGAFLTIMNALYHELHIPAMEQSLRQAAFEVLQLLVETNPVNTELNDRATDFAAGFVRSMEGEKDPRCLVICLRLVQQLLQDHGSNLELFAEQIFDVTGCYFPVTFTPPPNDPHGITRDILSNHLLDALTSHSVLASYVFPMALEKLASNVAQAKQDSLELLRVGIERFGVKTCHRFLRDVSDALLNEILHASDDASAKNALFTVSHITRTICKACERVDKNFPISFISKESLTQKSDHDDVEINDDDMGINNEDGNITTSAARTTWIYLSPADQPGPISAWTEFVQRIVASSIAELKRAVDSLSGRASGRLLVAVARADGYAQARTAKSTIPMLLSLYHEQGASKPSVRSSALRMLAAFVAATDSDVDYPQGCRPLDYFVDTLFSIFTSVLLHGPTQHNNVNDFLDIAQLTIANEVPVGGAIREARCVATQGLQDLVLRPPTSLLGLEQKLMMTGFFTDILLHDMDAIVRERCLSVLAELASRHEQFHTAVSSVAMPALLSVVERAFQGVHDRNDLHSDESDGNNLPWTLTALRALRAVAKLARGRLLFAQAIRHLVACALESCGNGICMRQAQLKWPETEADDQQQQLMTEFPSIFQGTDIFAVPAQYRYASCVILALSEIIETNRNDEKVLRRCLTCIGKILPTSGMTNNTKESDKPKASPDYLRRMGADDDEYDELVCRATAATATANIQHVGSVAASAVLRAHKENEDSGCFANKCGMLNTMTEQLEARSSRIVPSNLTLFEVMLGLISTSLTNSHSQINVRLPPLARAWTTMFTILASHLPAALQLQLRHDVMHQIILDYAVHEHLITDTEVTKSSSEERGLDASVSTWIISALQNTNTNNADARCIVAQLCIFLRYSLPGHAGACDAVANLTKVLCQWIDASALNNETETMSQQILTVAALLNRTGGLARAGDHEAETALNSSLQILQEHLKNQSSSTNSLRANALLHVYVTKSLFMSGHRSSLDWLNTLCGVFNDTQVSADRNLIAHSMGLLVRDIEPLRRSSGAFVHALYQQKLCTRVMMWLKPWTDTSQESSPSVYSPLAVVALCSLLADAPNSLASRWCIESEGKMLRVVLVALQNAVADLQGSADTGNTALDTVFAATKVLLTLLQSKNEDVLAALSIHSNSLARSLVQLLRHDIVPLPAIRANAIECLYAMTNFPYRFLHPLRNTVVKALTISLEDPRRPVRRRAVVCRNGWLTHDIE